MLPDRRSVLQISCTSGSRRPQARKRSRPGAVEAPRCRGRLRSRPVSRLVLDRGRCPTAAPERIKDSATVGTGLAAAQEAPRTAARRAGARQALADRSQGAGRARRVASVAPSSAAAATTSTRTSYEAEVKIQAALLARQRSASAALELASMFASTEPGYAAACADLAACVLDEESGPWEAREGEASERWQVASDELRGKLALASRQQMGRNPACRAGMLRRAGSRRRRPRTPSRR